MKMRRRHWLTLLVIVLSVAFIWFSNDIFLWLRSGPRHEFALENRPEFLTEELAVNKALAALALDGFDPGEWQAERISTGETAAPDGRKDKYLNRYGPNRGSIYLVGPKHQTRLITIELTGDRCGCPVFDLQRDRSIVRGHQEGRHSSD